MGRFPDRKQIITWLDQNQIGWCPCGHIANENFMMSYSGRIYIDVPYDVANAAYQRLRDYLKFPHGSMRFAGVKFWNLPLETAMKNAHHDEPGFWDRWAEDLWR